MPSTASATPLDLPAELQPPRPRVRASAGAGVGALADALPRSRASWRVRALAASTAFALAGFVGEARAVEPLQQLDVVLLEPGAVIEQRVEGGADGLADYLKRIAAAATEAMRAHARQLPDAGFIVVAARPDGLTRTWFDFRTPLMAETAAALEAAVAGVKPSPVRSDEVVFALRVSLWGGRAGANLVPVPPEWREAGRRLAAAASAAGQQAPARRPTVDELVDKLWPR